MMATLLTAGLSRGETLVLEQGVDGYEGTTDNSIYEDRAENSAGGYTLLFSGMTVSSFRRALIRFSLDPVAAGFTPESVSLQLHLDFSGLEADDSDVYTLHRLTSPWGEGNVTDVTSGEGGLGAPAETGDATWTDNFFNESEWQTPGGDFVVAPSASLAVARWDSVTPENNFYVFASDGMRADVDFWLKNPEQNYGWILIGNETRSRSARRWDSSESATAGLRPQLSITGTVGTEGWILY